MNALRGGWRGRAPLASGDAAARALVAALDAPC